MNLESEEHGSPTPENLEDTHNEPSVLDFVKARLMPWRYSPVTVPAGERPDEGADEKNSESSAAARDEPAAETWVEPGAAPVVQPVESPEYPQVSSQPGLGETPTPEPEPDPEPPGTGAGWPWRSLAALALAIGAQLALEPPERALLTGVIFYGLALLMLGWSIRRGEWQLSAIPERQHGPAQPLTFRSRELLVGAVLAVLAFVFFGGQHQFNALNLALWLGSLFFIVRAFWLPEGHLARGAARLRALLAQDEWKPRVTRWGLLFLLVLGIAAFFRFYRLDSVPPEMVSDHAEKLLDVYDVLNGQPRIFFPRNTGREFFQMYLTAGVIRLFDTGFSFLSLKIGTALAGLLTLPFIYLLGVEIANRRVGLLAMLFAGIAYWPNVISRIALRFTLYPFFAAPAFYFLVRGLNRRSRNDFILSGIFLGLGLHGYSTMRIVPLLMVVAVVLYLLHRQSLGGRKQAVYGLVLLALTSLIVFIPLMRYAVDNPEMVSYRALTRLSSTERELPGSPVLIFFDNLWKSLAMFAWDNGRIWVHSVTGRPALDVISAALFHLGVVLGLVRYVRKRNWIDLLLLVSIPILMLPSILSLAFPDENPSLNRSGAALIPVFLLLGLALDGLMGAFEKQIRRPWGSRAAWALVVVLFCGSALQNYDLVFRQYQEVYEQSSWNTSEIGTIIRDFTETVGDSEHAWVVAFPYWVDTRLAGINAGFPTRDYAIWPEAIPTTAGDQQTKLFILNLDDTQGLAVLQNTFPQGVLSLYPSRVEGKDFYIFFVPGEVSGGIQDQTGARFP